MSTKSKRASHLPTVVLVGRINVGKSSLFNRLTETGNALVSPIPGTTRDYNMATVDWRRKTFALIDTGGINVDSLTKSIEALLPTRRNTKRLAEAEGIEKEIVAQTKAALEKADLILMVVDGKSGLLPEDKELARVIKKLQRPILLVCNKMDKVRQRVASNEFFSLGLGTPYPVSASNSSGVGDFLDELVEQLPKAPQEIVSTTPDNEEKPIRITFIGKPNVGKSSLVNQLIGEHRLIVSDIPHTTRESQDIELTHAGKKIVLVDTAGLRKKANIEHGLERLSTRKTLSAIKNSDVVFFMTEAHEPLTKQDAYLAGLVKDSGKSIVIIANKWDLIEDKDTHTDQRIKTYYQRYFPFLTFAPLLFISALTGRNTDTILDTAIEVYQERFKKIAPEELEPILKQLIARHKPSQARGPYKPHIYRLVQTGTEPPEFTITVGPQQSVHFSYIRFIENQLRYQYNFTGTPIRIHITKLKKNQTYLDD